MAKVRTIGLSNWTRKQLKETLASCRVPLQRVRPLPQAEGLAAAEAAAAAAAAALAKVRAFGAVSAWFGARGLFLPSQVASR